MLTGMNHLTLAVADLDRSLHFYQDILKMTLHTRWKYGAYLTCGELWICLSADPKSFTGLFIRVIPTTLSPFLLSSSRPSARFSPLIR